MDRERTISKELLRLVETNQYYLSDKYLYGMHFYDTVDLTYILLSNFKKEVKESCFLKKYPDRKKEIDFIISIYNYKLNSAYDKENFYVNFYLRHINNKSDINYFCSLNLKSFIYTSNDIKRIISKIKKIDLKEKSKEDRKWVNNLLNHLKSFIHN